MKKKEDETPVSQVERSRWMLIAALVASALLGTVTFLLFQEMNPIGFVLMVPALFLVFNTLWLLLNPFATFFKDRLEIRPTMMQRSLTYFNDVRRVSEEKDGHIYIVYRDEEVERLNLFGIGAKEKKVLCRQLSDQVTAATQV